MHTLKLCSITINTLYRKEWNINLNDFVHLVKDGKLLNNNLYRVGGIGSRPNGNNYFMLLKYIEATHEISFISDDNKKYLKSYWCILDPEGNEIISFENSNNTPHLIKNNCIYSFDRKYYNLKTGECYGKIYSTVMSENFLFLQNEYDKDESKHGVLKVNKKDGTYELFK